jgi:hypothetical protein
MAATEILAKKEIRIRLNSNYQNRIEKVNGYNGNPR